MKPGRFIWGITIWLTGCATPEISHQGKERKPVANDELVPEEGKRKAGTETYKFNNGMIIMPNECGVPADDSGTVLR